MAAARTGELSFERLAASALTAFAEAAIDAAVRQPLTVAVEAGVAGGFGGFFGQRAAGGPVAPGGAVLVGEHGPELFRPTTSGSVAPVVAAPVTVNVALAGGAGGGEGVRRSLPQLEAAVARAVARGRRSL